MERPMDADSYGGNVLTNRIFQMLSMIQIKTRGAAFFAAAKTRNQGPLSPAGRGHFRQPGDGSVLSGVAPDSRG